MIQPTALPQPSIIPERLQHELLACIPTLAKNPQVPLEEKLLTLTELPCLPSFVMYENLSKILSLCPHLKILSLSYVDTEQDRWCELLSNVKELQSFSLGQGVYFSMNTRNLVTAINRYCPKLIKLSLAKTMLDKSGLTPIASLTQLEELKLNDVRYEPVAILKSPISEGLTDKDIKPLKTLKHLRVLNLSGNPSLTVETLSVFKDCKQLVSIDVRGCNITAKQALDKITHKRFPHLMSLAINEFNLDKALVEKVINSSQLETVCSGNSILYTQRNKEQIISLMRRLYSKNPNEITAQSVREVKEEEKAAPSLPVHMGGESLLVSWEQIALGFDCARLHSLKSQYPSTKVTYLDMNWGEASYREEQNDHYRETQIHAKYLFTKCTYTAEVSSSAKILVPEAWVHFDCIIAKSDIEKVQYRVTVPLNVIQEIYNKQLNRNDKLIIDFVDAADSRKLMTDVLIAIDEDLKKALVHKRVILESFPNISLETNEEKGTIALYVIPNP